jgi:hypothetical protein
MAHLLPACQIVPGHILREGRGDVKEAGRSAILPRAMALENAGALEERILRRIPVEIVALAAALAVVAGLVFDPLTGLFFFAGGIFSALGFAWLKHSLTRLLSMDKRGALRSGVVLYALRLVLICAVFFLIILLYPKKILAFVAGFSTVVPVALVEGVRALLLIRSWKD